MARRLLTVLLTVLVASCATPRYQMPPARVAGQAQPPASAVGEEATLRDAADKNRALVVPLPILAHATAVPRQQDLSARFPNDNALTVAVEAMSLKDLLNYVFGELLKVSYVVADGTPGLDQPVTLNLQAPISSRALYKFVAELLNARNLTIVLKEGVYFVVPSDGKGKGNVPIGFGRNPEDVPDVPGRILQMVPLRYGSNISIERTVHDLVDAQVLQDVTQSALFVTGERQAILKVLDVVRLLDQPSTRAKSIALVNLTYVGSKEFIDQLMVLLENEGIPTGAGRAEGKNVALVPLEQLGAVVVFASSSELLQRVEFWARQVDRPNQGPSLGYFIYHPKYARAGDLGESLAPLIGPGDSGARGNLSRDTRSALGAQGTAGSSGPSATGTGTGTGTGTQTAARRDSGGGAGQEQPVSIHGDGLTMSVDPRSNSLIFYTTGTRYESLLPMVKRLDVPPKQILLEAIIAEVDLTGEFAHGVEFALTQGKYSGGTAGGLGLPSGGLGINYLSGLTKVNVQLLETNSLVNILSNPLLVVRDGVQAHISVGNDVPTVGATTSSPTTSNLTITSVLYRHTGLTLDIRPTINAQGLVVMEINQDLSDTESGGSSVQGAPIFFDRTVTTEVVARSGQTILLAGLISENRTDSLTGVPWLGRIPGLGWLFNSVSKQTSKTELILMITPRIIETPDDWDAIRGGLERSLELIKLPPASGSAAPAPAGQPAPAKPSAAAPPAGPSQ